MNKGRGKWSGRETKGRAAAPGEDLGEPSFRIVSKHAGPCQVSGVPVTFGDLVEFVPGHALGCGERARGRNPAHDVESRTPVIGEVVTISKLGRFFRVRYKLDDRWIYESIKF